MKIPDSFLIGSSMSSWQYEGKFNGENENFIEMMYRLDGQKWHNNYGPDKAIHFLENIEQDVKQIVDLGLQSVRFTIDWSRFIDDMEQGTVNEKYAEKYDLFIDLLIKNEIVPILILEHWDLPTYIYEKYDGYSSEKTDELYLKYAKQVFNRYNGKIKYWMTFNEPIVIPEQCFCQLTWYPYETNLKKAILWMHRKNICSAKSIKLFRELNIKGEIGIGGLNVELVKVKDPSNVGDRRAGEIASYLFEKKFLMPAVYGHYDKNYLKWLKDEELDFEFTDEEKQIMNDNTVDFIGINYYHPRRVQSPLESDKTAYGKYFSDYHDTTVEYNKDRGWEVSPETLYDLAIILKREYKNVKWFVNENGYGCVEEEKERNENNEIQDDYRIDFVKRHITELIKAVNEECNCFGYHTWSIMDNCSPYNAMKNRYGYIEVDISRNYVRRFKKSAYYIKKVIKTRKI